jgi:hypothetical protein
MEEFAKLFGFEPRAGSNPAICSRKEITSRWCISSTTGFQPVERGASPLRDTKRVVRKVGGRGPPGGVELGCLKFRRPLFGSVICGSGVTAAAQV